MQIGTSRWIGGSVVCAIIMFAGGVRCEAAPVSNQVATLLRGSWCVADSEETVNISESALVRRWKAPEGFMPPFIHVGTNAEMGSEKDATGRYWGIETYSYVLHTDATPMAIDLAVVDEKGVKYLFKGIFDLQSDRLLICYSTPGGARPKDFAKSQDGCILLTLQREKK